MKNKIYYKDVEGKKIICCDNELVKYIWFLGYTKPNPKAAIRIKMCILLNNGTVYFLNQENEDTSEITFFKRGEELLNKLFKVKNVK